MGGAAAGANRAILGVGWQHGIYWTFINLLDTIVKQLIFTLLSDCFCCTLYHTQIMKLTFSLTKWKYYFVTKYLEMIWKLNELTYFLINRCRLHILRSYSFKFIGCAPIAMTSILLHFMASPFASFWKPGKSAHHSF